MELINTHKSDNLHLSLKVAKHVKINLTNATIILIRDIFVTLIVFSVFVYIE